MTTAQPGKIRRGLSDPDVRRDILLSLGALVIVVLFLFPIYWLIQMSFKSDGEIFAKTITYFPQKISLDGYKRNFGDQDYIRSLINSIVISLETMGLSLVFGIPAAYGLGRYKNRVLHAILLALLVSQMLPASVMLTQLYLNEILTAGQLIAGLLVGAGVGLLVLFRTNRSLKENLKILALLFALGLFWGMVIEGLGLRF